MLCPARRAVHRVISDRVGEVIKIYRVKTNRWIAAHIGECVAHIQLSWIRRDAAFRAGVAATLMVVIQPNLCIAALVN